MGCRCDFECGYFSINKCKKCYSLGGMVSESYLGGCYCPFENSFLNLNVDENILTCQNPLPRCPECFACDSSCLNCFGPNQNQCTSCPPDFDLVTTLNPDGFLSSFFFFFFLSFLFFLSSFVLH